jgi:glutathione S-transferase
MVLVTDLMHLCVDEIDPYKKPKELVEISPKSMVPSIKLNNYSPPRGLNESMVILEFLEELGV